MDLFNSIVSTAEDNVCYGNPCFLSLKYLFVSLRYLANRSVESDGKTDDLCKDLAL